MTDVGTDTGIEELESGDSDALTELRNELADLRRAFVEDRRRPTEASAERVEDAEDDVVTAARKAGVSPSQYQAAIKAAKRAQFKDDYAEVIREVFDELLEERKPKPKPKPKQQQNGKPEPEGDETTSDEDEAPVVEHWSNRSIGEMIFGKRG